MVLASDLALMLVERKADYLVEWKVNDSACNSVAVLAVGMVMMKVCD
jgi:hypothetical protein